ncbi:hypothetical protein BKI49_15780 [Streptomyces sp. Tue6028]|uniref:hypothetical protein n=1 Tax=Streptomyces sp. Tue6028 TaxID=2036037 RepID=UPI000BB39289|nr:hypothetical protein [Streptomyces sp. Tue6028]PBC62722.1 hypothetical protein BKI49_15780 [Streptomyces sp. Tue6028]
MTVIDRSLTGQLKRRGLFLTQERSDVAEIVYVCVDDGLPGGFPVGYVIPSRAGAWSAYARVRPGVRVFATDEVGTGLPDVVEAVRAVLDHARYGDVLFALEQETDRDGTYTAQVRREHAAWFAALDAPEGITQLGDGRIRLTAPAVAYLRGLPARLGCHVDGDDRIRLAGESYVLTREPRRVR